MGKHQIVCALRTNVLQMKQNKIIHSALQNQAGNHINKVKRPIIKLKSKVDIFMYIFSLSMNCHAFSILTLAFSILTLFSENVDLLYPTSLHISWWWGRSLDYKQPMKFTFQIIYILVWAEAAAAMSNSWIVTPVRHSYFNSVWSESGIWYFVDLNTNFALKDPPKHGKHKKMFNKITYL